MAVVVLVGADLVASALQLSLPPDLPPYRGRTGYLVAAFAVAALRRGAETEQFLGPDERNPLGEPRTWVGI